MLIIKIYVAKLKSRRRKAKKRDPFSKKRSPLFIYARYTLYLLGGLIGFLAILIFIPPIRNFLIELVALLLNAFVLSNIFVCNIIFIVIMVLLILVCIYIYTRL